MSNTVIKIYRPNWRRGGDTEVLSRRLGDTSLCDSGFKQMCCLGQIAHQMGCPITSLEANPEISDIDLNYRYRLLHYGQLVVRDDDEVRQKKVCLDAMPINDDPFIGDSEREQSLSHMFREEGIELQFVDDVAPWFSEVPA